MIRFFLLCTIPTLVMGAAVPVFTKDVLPILQNHCQECHRPDEIGPMPLLTYAQTRPWAKAIKSAVLEGKMPPWPADPETGKFAHARTLTREEKDTLAAWADGGSPQGRATEAPPARVWVEGWNIPEPDVVIRMPEPASVPAKGSLDYQYAIVPTGFTEDKWVQAVELRPSNRALLHHAIVFLREPGNRWLAGLPAGVTFVPPGNSVANVGGGGNEMLLLYTPGILPGQWEPGRARLIKAGTDLVFQMHYTANGIAGTDQSSIGLVFAKEPPKQRIVTALASNQSLRIPPGDANYSAKTVFMVREPMTLLSVTPHMHLRGKAFQYDVVYPDGHAETILKVDKWSLNWQLSYTLAEPIQLQPGTRVQATAWWDNSANNPANPDPTATVFWGEQSWQEMMTAFMDVALDARSPVRGALR